MYVSVSGNSNGPTFRKTLIVLLVSLLAICFITIFHMKYGITSFTIERCFSKALNHSRVFYMETSERGVLSLRQLVAVESSALLNPEKEIVVYLFVNETVSKSALMLSLQKTYSNILFEFVSMADYVQGSLLEQWHRDRKWKCSATPWAHTSDGLRLLELWRRGGIYLDLDIMTLKKLDLPLNAITWENDTIIANGAMAFQKKHAFILSAMKGFRDNFNPNDYIVNGPQLITTRYKSYYKDLGVDCDVEVLPVKTVTPLNWTNGMELFDEKITKETIEKTKDSLALHWWNHLSKDLKIPTKSTCAFMTLVPQRAPVTWLEVLKIGWL